MVHGAQTVATSCKSYGILSIKPSSAELLQGFLDPCFGLRYAGRRIRMQSIDTTGSIRDSLATAQVNRHDSSQSNEIRH